MSNHITTPTYNPIPASRPIVLHSKKKNTLVSPTFSEKSTHSKPHIQPYLPLEISEYIEDESGCLLSPISN